MAAIENLKDKENLQTGAKGADNQLAARSALFVFRPMADLILSESGRWFLWSPVFLGLGIAFYFLLKFEPPLFMVLIVFALAAGIAALPRKNPVAFPLVISLLLVASGFLLAKLRSDYVAAPVLSKRLGPVSVTGVLEYMTGKARGGKRLIIRPLHIDRLVKSKMPRRLQLTARMAVPDTKSGDVLQFRAILMPPPGAVQPNGFSYARMAWFKQIGATGFLVSSPRVTSSRRQEGGLQIGNWIEQLRANVTARILKGSSGKSGGVAAALITGEKGALNPQLRDKMRSAGLAHLLAISGLHMALFGGALFAFSRAIFALSASLTLKYPIKKWAAFIALIGAAAYLLLSGGSIATQRAFIMISIMFLAVILDRRALSMRNVALAALIVLLIRPESLFNVSFQMSFAAVIALIAVYESGLFWIPLANQSRGKLSVLGRILLIYMLGNILTSIVAGSATGPFAAYHFHRFALYGVLGNIAAVPVMALLIMPAALAALMLMPLGLESIPLAIMGFGIEIVIEVAGQVAALPGAVGMVPTFHQLALPLMIAGGLWLCLWKRLWRLAGIIPILAGLIIAPFGSAPDVLIARNGDNLAVRNTAGKLSVLYARKGAYSVRKWLESDGDQRSPREAAKQGRGAFSCDSLACVTQLENGISLAFIRHLGALEEECRRSGIIVAKIPVRRRWCKGAAHIIDFFDLRRNGATSIILHGDKISIQTAADFEGNRPWSTTRQRSRKRSNIK